MILRLSSEKTSSSSDASVARTPDPPGRRAKRLNANHASACTLMTPGDGDCLIEKKSGESMSGVQVNFLRDSSTVFAAEGDCSVLRIEVMRREISSLVAVLVVCAKSVRKVSNLGGLRGSQ